MINITTAISCGVGSGGGGVGLWRGGRRVMVDSGRVAVQHIFLQNVSLRGRHGFQDILLFVTFVILNRNVTTMHHICPYLNFKNVYMRSLPTPPEGIWTSLIRRLISWDQHNNTSFTQLDHKQCIFVNLIKRYIQIHLVAKINK